MIKPVGKSIVIKVVEKGQESSIILPKHVKVEKEISAVIESVSDDGERGLKPGDEVLLRAGAEGSCIALPGDEKRFVLPESFVVAIMNYEE